MSRGVLRKLVVIILLHTLWPTLVLAQQPTAGVVTTLQGVATVARAALPQEVPLKFKDDVFYRDRITTKENSLIRVLLGGKALVTVRELSVLTLTEEPGKATVDVQSGKIGLAVARQRMRPGESIEIRTPNAMAAVRGTVIIVEVIPPAVPGGVSTTLFNVLKGSVTISLPQVPTAAPVTVQAGQSLPVTGNTVGPIGTVSPTVTAGLTASTGSQHSEAPAATTEQVSANQQAQATVVALAIAPAAPAPTAPAPTGSEQPPSTSDLGVQEEKGGTPPPPPPPPTPLPFAIQGFGALSVDPGTSLVVFSAGSTQVPEGGGLFCATPPCGPIVLTAPAVAGSAPGGSTIDATTSTGEAVLTITGTTLTAGGAPLFAVTGPLTVNVSKLLAVDPSSLTLSGSLLTISSATLNSAGTLVSAMDSTINATGAGVPLVSVDNGNLNVTGSFLESTDSNITVNGPLIQLKNGSTATVTGGPAITISGGSLTADMLGTSDSTGNTFNLGGTLLDLSNTAVTLKRLGKEVPDNDNDTVNFNLALNQPAIKVSSSTLTLTDVDEDLMEFGEKTGPVPTQPGVALIAGGTAAQKSTINLKGSLLKLKGVQSTATDALIQLDNTVVNQTGTTDALIFINPQGLNSTMAGPMLTATDTTIAASGPVLHFQGPGSLTSNTTGAFLTVDPSSVTSPSTFAVLNGGFNLRLKGTFLSSSSSTLTVSGAGNSLVSLDGSSLTVDGSLLDSSGSTITVPGPLVQLKNGSTITNTVGPVIKMTGGSLTADALGIGDSTGNTWNLTGTILDLTNATVTLRTLGEDVPDNGNDTAIFNLALNEPFVKMSSSTLTTTKVDDSLADFGVDSGPIPTVAGVGVVATGTAANPSTINLKGILLDLGGVNLSATDPMAQLDHAVINQTGTTEALIYIGGLPVTMAGPILAATDSTITTSGPFLEVLNGSLVSNTSEHFIDIDPSTVTSGSNFARIDGPSASVTLHGKLLSASDSTFSSANGFSFIIVSGGASLTTAETSDPLVFFSNSNVTAGGSSGGQFFHVLAAGSKVILSGGLLDADGATITAGGNLVRIANGGSLTSTTTGDLLSFTGGSFTGGGTLGTATGGSLLRMFSETGQPGTSLSLVGRYLSSSGATFLSKDAPAFNIADGATLIAAGDFASFQTGSATSAYSFFNIETNTSYTPPGQPTVVGSGSPVSVTVGGTLIDATNFKFTTQNNGNFLNLKNGVTLTQTAKSPLVLLDGTGLGPSDFAINAAGDFLAMSAAAGLSAPSLILGGSLLDALNAKIKTGDPTANAFSFIFIADGATVVGPTDPPALLAFDNASVDTSGNILTLRRSKFTGSPTSPTSVTSSTLTLSGPLFSATNGSTFNTSSLGFGSACCSGFHISQGAQLTAATTSSLIELTNSTFSAGPDAQSGGSFVNILDTYTGAAAGDVVAPASVTLGNASVIAGPLLTATDSTISALFSLVSVTRSSLTSNSTGPLIDLNGTTGTGSGVTTVNLGGVDPFTGSTTSGNLLSVVSAGSPFGTPAAPASVSLAGPLLTATNANLTITGSVIGVFGGASLTSTATSALAQLDNSSLTAGTASITGNVLNVGGTGSTSGTTLASVSLKGPLLTASNGSALNVTGRLASIFGGGQVTVTGSTDPFVSISGGSHSLATSAGAGMFTIGSGASLSLSGGLLSLSNATINTTGQMLQAGSGTLSTGGPLLTAQSGSLTSTTTGSFMNIGANTITSPENVIGLYDNFGLSLQGSLLTATDVNFSATSNQFSFFAIADGASVATSGTNNALLQFTGTAPGLSKVTAARNFLPMAKTDPSKPAPSMNLSGPLLSAVKTDFKTGDPTANTHTFLFIGDGAQLTSASSSPLMSFDNSTVDTAGNILTLRRSAFTGSATSPTTVTPSKLTLSGPLFSAVNGSSFNTSSLGFGSACCSGFHISQGAQLIAATTSSLINLANSTFSAGPDAQSGGSFLSITDTYTGAPAGDVIAPASVTLGNSTVTAGPLLTATDSTITALFSLVSVTRSSVTSNSSDPLIRLIGTTGSGSGVTTVTLGGADPFTGSTTNGFLFVMSSSQGSSNAPTTASLKGPLLEAVNSSITTTGATIGIFNGSTLTSDTTSAFVSLNNTSLTSTGTGTSFPSGDFLNVSGKGGAAGTTPSSATFKGPLLVVTNGSNITLQRDVIIGSSNATITGTGSDAFIQVSGASLTTGSTGEVAGIFNGTTLSLKGPLLSVASTLTAPNGLVNIATGGSQLVVTGSTDPLVFISGGTQSIATNSNSSMFGVGSGGSLSLSGGLLHLSNATVNTNGKLLFAGTGSTLTVGGHLLKSQDGGQLFVSDPTSPLVSITGGNPSIGEATQSAAFSLKGITTASETADGVPLTLGTDEPLKHSNAGGFPVALFQTTDATVTAHKGFKIDTALLQASAPLFNLLKGSGSGSNLTFTGPDANAGALDLSVKAKVTSLGVPVFRLDGSTMTVQNGAVASLAGGSYLKVTGDLIHLLNGSTLSLLNGPILNVTGSSVVNISGALVAYNGGTNTLNVTNSLCPCTNFGPIPVALTGGATASNVSIGSNPLKSLGGGTLVTNLSSNAALIVVNGASSKVTIIAP